MDASVSFGEGEACGKVGEKQPSSAYSPPEMVAVDEVTGEVFVRSAANISTRTSARSLELLDASPSWDMWSLGAVLFELCTGEPLLLSNDEDNTDLDGLLTLHAWSDEVKQCKVDKIGDKNARNLVSRLLNKDPAKRPSPSAVLDHPFLSGKAVTRLVGEVAAFDGE